jgi:hypothetical protein
MPENKEERNLTDADVEAITEAMRKKIIKEFYQDLGQGVWAFFWKAIIIAMISIAAYGATKGVR